MDCWQRKIRRDETKDFSHFIKQRRREREKGEEDANCEFGNIPFADRTLPAPVPDPRGTAAAATTTTTATAATGGRGPPVRQHGGLHRCRRVFTRPDMLFLFFNKL